MKFEISEQYTSAYGGGFDILVEGCSFMFRFTNGDFTELEIEKTEKNKAFCLAHYEKEYGKLPQLTHGGTVYIKFISKTDTANLLGARYTKQTATLTVNRMTITSCISNMLCFGVCEAKRQGVENILR